MPELPEVETVLRAIIANGIIGSTISKIEIKKKTHIKEISPEMFVEKLLGQTIRKIERKGKWLFFISDNQVIISHLRMTGKYFFVENNQIPSLIFYFSNGKKLFYCDPRGFGVFYLQSLESYQSLKPYKEIGPDLAKEKIETNYLLNKFKKIKSPIKSVLLDQKIMSGIGNIYASEILFSCKINPLKPANEISYEETEKIINHSKIILQKAIDLGGTSVVDFVSPTGKGSYQNKLKVYMRENKPCYECKLPIVAKTINNRNTFFCNECQKYNFLVL